MSAVPAPAPVPPETPSGSLLSHPPASDSPPTSTWSSSTGDDSPTPNPTGPTYRHPSTFSFNPTPSPTKLGPTPIDALTRFRMLNITPPPKDPPNHALRSPNKNTAPELKNASTNTAPIPTLTTPSSHNPASTPSAERYPAPSTPSTTTAVPSIDKTGIPASTPQPAPEHLTTPVARLVITPAASPPPADLIVQPALPVYSTPQTNGAVPAEADPDSSSSPGNTPGGAGLRGTPEQVARVLKSQLHQTQSAHKSLVGRLRQAEARIQQLEAEVETQREEIAAASELADSLEEEVSLLHERLEEVMDENSELKSRLAEAEERLAQGGGFKRNGRPSEGGNVFASISDFRSLRASLTIKAGSLTAAESDPTYGPALRVGSSLQQQVDLMQNAMKEAAKNKEERNMLERKLRDLEMKSEQRYQSLVAQNRQLKMELQCEKDETSKLRRLLIQTQADPGTSTSNGAPLGSPSKFTRVAAAKIPPATGDMASRPEVSKVPDELRQEIWRYAKDLEDANRRLVNEKMELEVSWLTAANQLHEVDKQLKTALESKEVLQRALKRLEEKQQLQMAAAATGCSPSDSLDASLPPLAFSPVTPSLARAMRHTISALGAAADAVVQVHGDVGMKDQLGTASLGLRLGGHSGTDAKT